MGKNTENQLVVLDGTRYPVLACDSSELRELFDENLGDNAISIRDIPAAHVPSGGRSMKFQVGVGSQLEDMDAIEGIVIGCMPNRRFWYEATPSKKPPSCSSIDGLAGVGKPGGDCAVCPYNAWGSIELIDPRRAGQRGKACKHYEILLMIVPGSLMPLAVHCSPGSLASLRTYKVSLMSRMKRLSRVLTRITLSPASSRGDVDYCLMDFAMVGDLPPDLLDRVTAAGTLFAKLYRCAQQTGQDSIESMRNSVSA